MGQGPAMVRGPVDQLLQSAPAQLAQRRIDSETPRASGKLWVPVQLIARGGVGHVARPLGHGRLMRERMGGERQAAIIGDVQPFVPVGGPGIGRLDPPRKVTEDRAGRGP